LREPLDGLERGFLLETWVLHELRAAMAARNTGGQLHYWRTPFGTEVDFVWTRGACAVGIEVKSSHTWRPEHGSALKGLVDQGILTGAHGIYAGSAPRRDGPVHVWPIMTFLRRLTDGDILR